MNANDSFIIGGRLMAANVSGLAAVLEFIFVPLALPFVILTSKATIISFLFLLLFFFYNSLICVNKPNQRQWRLYNFVRVNYPWADKIHCRFFP